MWFMKIWKYFNEGSGEKKGQLAAVDASRLKNSRTTVKFEAIGGNRGAAAGGRGRERGRGGWWSSQVLFV